MPLPDEILRAVQTGRLSLDDAERQLAGRGAAVEATGASPDDAPSRAAAPPGAHADPGKGRVAVIGMSGRYPGAEDVDALWRSLAEGRCAVREIPPSRWDVRPRFQPLPIQPGRIYCKWMGMLDDVESFDPLFFGISPGEAELMDPQHRIFLEEAYRALEDAGCAGRAVGAARCGVYLGIMGNEYLTMLHARCGDAVNTTGNSFAIAAARLSYFLDLKGPAIAVDTACSSSLVATHLACRALLGGEIDLAVVGGVSLYLSPMSYVGMCAAGMLSPDGRCRAFDDGANGFVPGEGAGALVLKRLTDAEADGDAIHGVIAGTAVNQDGRTNGITAPSVTSQIAVEREVYERSGVDPRDVTYVEMHGTGTKLGDPVELEALATVFAERGVGQGRCVIGSVKTNLGHTSAAAGVASIQKVLLSLRHGQIPPSLHFSKPNEHFDLARSPFRVATALEPWHASGKPRRAAVSSFGFSGTNAHLVIEEYVPARAGAGRAAAAPGPFLFPISARTEERLRAVAGRLAAWVEATGDVALAELAYTLQSGRDAMQHRAAFLASSRDEVLRALRGLAAGTPPQGVLAGHGRKGGEEVVLLEQDEDAERLLRSWFSKGKLDRLAALWVRGLHVDWRRIHPAPAPRRLHLPTYPFLRQRCWLPAAEPPPASGASAGALHPLVHRNASDLFELRYTATFTGDEPELQDHRVGGRRVMSGAALLEMARAAVAQACRAGDAVRLEDVRWIRPLVVEGGPTEIEVRLSPEGPEAVSFEIRSAEPDGAQGAAHATGRVQLSAPGEAPRVNLAALRATCGARALTGAECYAAFEAAGLAYGPSHRAIERLEVGDGEALAKLTPAAGAAQEGVVLPPGLLDSALQAALGAASPVGARAPLPVALDVLEVHGGCAAARWAHVRRAGGGAAGEQRFDVELLEDSGRVCARAIGFTVRAPASEAQAASAGPRPLEAGRLPAPGGRDVDGLVTLAPVWDAVRPGDGDVTPPTGVAVVVGGDAAARGALLEVLPGARVLEPGDLGEDALAASLSALGDVGHLVWIVPGGEAPDLDAIPGEQRRGVLQLFRLARAALRAGLGARRLDWTVATRRAARVHRAAPIDPTHAPVHGFMGSLAKEHPRWRVRVVDLEGLDGAPWPELLALPADPAGDVLARRGGAWLRRKLVPVEPAAPSDPPPYRAGGVYVVVGGAGGLGEVWTEHVLRRHQAHVVWLGRRALDAAIQAKIDRLGALGPAPIYVQADARDRVALEEAYQAVKQRFARVHGVVHAALELRDQGLAQMTEDAFLAALTAKVDGCVRVAQLFRNDALDFLLFFSSAQSFQNAAGQSNYAAGCAFEDALALRLGSEWPCPVKVMNWGFWGEHGAVSTPAHRERMGRAGIASIAPAEGMAALDALLARPLDQVAFLKTARPVSPDGVDGSERLELLPELAPPALPQLGEDLAPSGGEALVAAEAAHRAELDAVLAPVLGAQLLALGVDEEALRSGAAADRVRHPFHRRWLEQTVSVLGLRRPGAPTLPRGGARDAAFSAWEARRVAWAREPGRRAEVELADRVLRALPDVLAGRRGAAEVMFEGEGLAQVEGLYRGNPIADAMNATVAAAVAAHVRRRVEQDPAARIRVLEIGGGTGGTTGAVLAALAPYRTRLDAYCFTDLSPTFLTRAEETWRAAHPYFATARLDVSAPVEGQAIGGGFDVVVAANVLHATRDVRGAVRNVKAALRRHGLLAATEISDFTLFTHVTVGLLEGWWLAEDQELRIPGSPGLTPERWAELLAEEGFAVALPTRAAHGTGQQVVLAESDGRVRRRAAPCVGPAASEAVAHGPAAPAAAPPSAPAREPVASAEGASDLEPYVREKVLALLARALKVDAGEVDLEDAFANYGLDSITGVQLVQRLDEALGIELTPTDLFDHGSVRRLTAYIVGRFGEALARRRPVPPPAPRATAGASDGAAAPGVSAQPPPRSPLARPAAHRPELARGARAGGAGPIAVVGMSGRFAGSPDVDALWAHLAAGDDLVGEVARWDLSGIHGGKRHCRHGSFVEDIDCFDPLFFRISATEARYMDPQQRLFLEEAWKALEDAGYAGTSDPARACGVFVGCSGGDYQSLFQGEPPPQAFWGNAGSIVPARIAYHLDLQGPAITVDTACSSSLVAVHLACQSLWSGESDLALAGGVFLQATPYFFVSAERAGMLSHGGRCFAFDERADGFVPGEGVGVVALKRLADALADGDHVHAVIRGSGTNQDGATNGITAPSARAQERLERHVYDAFGVDAGRIQLVEAHGTGTKLGDPIEVDALTRAFRASTSAVGACALGSIKTNLGHAAAAAGIAGLLKVVLALRHRQLPPSLHFRNANPKVRLEGSPFYVNTAAQPWEARGGPRLAAVSSFGFSGTNAHVVVEEAPPRARAPGAHREYLVPLSARTPQQLRALAAALARHCAQHPELELADVSHTLAQGRKHLEHRLACVASDRAELVDRLDRWLAGEADAGVRSGEARPGADGDAARQLGARAEAQGRAGRLAAAASSFVAGGALALDVLLEGERRGRVPLPTHPFARERYWVTGAAPAPSVPAAIAAHPLLRPGPSSGTGERFVVRLTGREPFVADHRVGGRSVLPGVAFLELARAAGACAGRSVTGLTGVSWVKPLVVPEGGLEVEVVVDPRGAGPALPFQVRSTTSAGEPIVHAEGGLTVGARAHGDLAALDVGAVEARCTARFDAHACYARLEALGLDLGPSLRPIEELRVGPGEVLAALELPDAAGAEPGLVLHPALLDGGLQCGIGLELGGASDALHVPFALERVEILGALPRRALAHLVVTGEGAARRAAVQIADRSGRVAVRLEGLVVRPLAARPAEIAATPSPGAPGGAVVLERVWEPDPPAPAAGEPAGSRVVVVLERDGGLADAVRGVLSAGAGAQVLSVAAPEWRALAHGAHALGRDRAADLDLDLERLLAQVAGAPDRVTLVHAAELAPADGAGADLLAAAALETASSLLHLVREARRRLADARVEVVALVPGRGAEGAPAAAVSGLVRSLALELPRLGVKTVELACENGAPSAEDLAAAVQEIVAGAPDLAEIAWTDGTRRRAAWREVDAAPPRDGGPWGEGRTYLVTGGMGAIGAAVARHLARRPRTRLVLCGRSALDEAGKARLRELEQLGAEVLHVQADVSRPEDVARIVEATHDRFGPLHGVLHAAGELRDGAASTKTQADLEAVLAAKVRGTALLDEATRGEPLELFVGFSSLAAVTGNVGQADYAYANAFMDAYLRARAGRVEAGERAGRSVSIAWPPWRSGGMRLDADRLERLRSATGLAPLETGDALALLDAAVANGPPAVLILSGDRARVGALVRRDAGSRVGALAPRELGRDLAAPARSPEELLREVLRLAAAVTGLDEGALSPDRSLADYGLDSLGFSTLAQRLGAGLGFAISPAAFFEFPTARAVAEHLAAEVQLRAPRAEPAPVPVPVPVVRPAAGATVAGLSRRHKAEPVAIVGIGGVMPGSRDLHAFWEHLEAGHDLVTEVPPDRWERAGFAAALARAGEAGRRLHGGFVDDVDRFDALFFGISPREAELMDPQQRILLETVWRAVEDAGYRMSDLAGSRTGVFVGASTADYADVVRASGVPIEGHMATGLAPSVLANRISFLFDLRGPSEPVDTACSSALVALHRAVDAVSTGACELAIAGGVNALLTPGVFISFLKAGMLSPDGRCKTFDRRANGYVRGEGAGAVLVKPLGRAEAAGDHVYAVVRGSAVNHGGRASSLTVPSMTAQADVLVEAYERAGVDPATVGYIEAHGTGTALGDPIEVDGLKRAFAELSRRRGARPTVGSCGLGSVKSNVGHLEAAAGMAGLLKVLLALRHETLPPTLHFGEQNPHIRLEGSPFYVVAERRAWAPARDLDGRPLPRRAGVSSFGFGGANAHVVLEEHVAATTPAAADGGPQVVPLSARSAERLVAQARGLLEHLDRAAGTAPGAACPGDLTLAALAYTLQVGREPFEHRFAAVVDSLEDLRARLRSFCMGAARDPACGFTGCAAEGPLAGGAGAVAEVARALAARDLPAIAALWASGAAVEWRRLHDRPQGRVSLPTYPFARDRHWVEGAAAAEPERAPASAAGRDGGEPPDAARSWRARLAGAGAGAARRGVLEAYLVEQISRMLKLGPARLDPGRPLVAVGFDSLMALQLRKKVATELELDVSLVRLLGGESAAELADRILAGGAEPAQAGVPGPEEIGAGIDEVLEGVL